MCAALVDAGSTAEDPVAAVVAKFEEVAALEADTPGPNWIAPETRRRLMATAP